MTREEPIRDEPTWDEPIEGEPSQHEPSQDEPRRHEATARSRPEPASAVSDAEDDGDADDPRDAEVRADAAIADEGDDEQLDDGDGLRPGAEPEPAEDDEPRTERRSDLVIVGLVFVVLYGYDLLEAITNLTQAPGIYEFLGLGAETPWVALVVGVAAPPLLFATAAALGRGRRLVARAGILLVGLGVSAQVALLLEALTRGALAA